MTNPNAIAGLVNRKSSYYTENRVYPYCTIDDFIPALFERAWNLIRGNNPRHPWLDLSNEELLKRAGFYRIDKLNQVEGYTLGAILKDTPQVKKMIACMEGELMRGEIQERLGLKDREYFRISFLNPSLEAKLVEMTKPESPRSPSQKYRLTEKGKRLKSSNKKKQE